MRPKRYLIRVKVLVNGTTAAWAIMGRHDTIGAAETDLLMHQNMKRECYVEDSFGSDYIPPLMKLRLSKWLVA